MKRSTYLIILSAGFLIYILIKAFIYNEGAKFYLLSFAVAGIGLAFLRMLVNGAIKKMKGKHFGVKVVFFAVLLGLGIPFQNWFRKDVILSMDGNYVLPCVLSAIASMIITTTLYNRTKLVKKVSQQ